MSTQYLYQGALYEFGVVNGAIALIKASKKVSEGQMSLFDSGGSGSFDESKHPRDHGKFTSKGGGESGTSGSASEAQQGSLKDRAHSKMEAALPDAIANFKASAAKFTDSLKGMKYQELDNLDVDGAINDDHWVNLYQHLEDHAKDGEHSDSHDEIDGHVEEFVESHPQLQGLYDSHSEQAEKAKQKRMNEIEAQIDTIHGDAIDGLNSDWEELTSDDDSWTFKDWQEKKDAITQSYKKHLGNGLKKLLGLEADEDTIDDFMEAMNDEHEAMTSSYSDDPEDYE